MNAQMMDGLLGSSSNLKLSGTPMSMYRQASAEGDLEKMKRALGDTGECTEKAALKNSQPVAAAEPIASEPAVYTPAGGASAVPTGIESNPA